VEYGDDNVLDTDTEQDTNTHTICTCVDSFTVAVSPPAPHTPIPPRTHPTRAGWRQCHCIMGG